MTQDEQHLDLLSIFHYVVGGLTAFFSCFPLIHLVMGILMLSGVFGGEEAPPRVFAWLFILFPLVFILMGWTLSILIIIAGRKLKARKSMTYCFVVAGIECILIPFGTVLGVLTLIVLSKESVKTIFGNVPPSAIAQ